MTDRPRRRQRGAALLTAMVVVTLVASLAAAMVWQQWRAVQVEAAERGRMQAAWILTGALDFSRMILRVDAKRDVDSLDEPWAFPLAEARLSTFLAADKDNTDDAPEAFLSGSIVDAQARYNLRNLENPAKKGTVDPAELMVLKRLCGFVSISDDVAERLASALVAARNGGGDAALEPRSLAQLGWLGLNADTVRRLAPHVVLLPAGTPVNLNTASKEVIAARIDLQLGDAERLVQTRERAPFKTIDAAKQFLPQGIQFPDTKISLMSNYFEVRGQLRLGDRVLQERSLVRRDANNVAILERERVNLNDPGS